MLSSKLVVTQIALISSLNCERSCLTLFSATDRSAGRRSWSAADAQLCFLSRGAKQAADAATNVGERRGKVVTEVEGVRRAAAMPDRPIRLAYTV